MASESQRSNNQTTNRPKGLMVLCPRRFCHSGVTEITIQDLKGGGIDTVILDLDNTLVGWQRHDFPDSVLAWIQELKESGFKLCLLSNTRFGRRLKKVSEELQIPYVKKAMKPSRKGFRAAMELLGSEPSKTVMI